MAEKPTWIKRIASLAPWQVALGLAALLLLLYGRVLNGEFIYDDHLQVEKNLLLSGKVSWLEYFQHPTGFYTHSPAHYYRPLHMVGYALAGRLFGITPLGFHLMNLLLALGCSVMVFLIMRRMFSPETGVLAALLFSLQPLHVEAVAWIAAMPELLAGGLILLLFYWHLQEQWPLHRQISSAVIFLMALLTRENALILPLLALAWDWCCDERATFRTSQAAIWRYGGWLLAGMVYFLLRRQVMGYWLMPAGISYPLYADEYLLSLVHLVGKYLGAMLLPPAYSGFYVFPPMTSLLQGAVIQAALIILGTVLLGRWLLRLDRRLFFLLVWIPIALVPFLYFPALGENLFTDRYAFLPTVGMTGLLAGLLVAGFRQTRGFRRRALWGLAVIMMVGWGILSGIRVGYWQSELGYFRQSVKAQPRAYPFWNALMAQYARQNQTAQAMAIAASFNQWFPGPEKITAGSAPTYAQVQALPDTERIFKKSFFQAQEDLAAMYFQQKEYVRAAAVYQKLLEIFPTHPRFFGYLGLCQDALGQSSAAMASFRQELTINPQSELARAQIKKMLLQSAQDVAGLCEYAHLLSLEGKYDEALAILQKAAGLDNRHPRPYHYMFNIYWMTKQTDLARIAIGQALQRDPQNKMFQYNYQVLSNPEQKP